MTFIGMFTFGLDMYGGARTAGATWAGLRAGAMGVATPTGTRVGAAATGAGRATTGGRTSGCPREALRRGGAFVGRFPRRIGGFAPRNGGFAL